MKFGYFCNTTNWKHKPYDQLLDETKEITAYCDEINWNSTNNQGQAVSAGVYLYSIEAAEIRSTKKMVLLK